MQFDHVLLIGFGGPTRPDEVEPFLREVTRGRNIPESRLEEVLHHYEAIGGSSPYHESVFRFAERLEENLKENGLSLPVFVGMRNWHPFLKETISEIERQGRRRGFGLVLAPQRSEASFDRYLRSVEEARQTVSASSMAYEYPLPWYDHPLFIHAQADEVRKLLNSLNPAERRATHLLFSAHSIPCEMAHESRYEEEVKTSSFLVAEALNHPKWSVAYQSRSGSPLEPWLEPDVRSVLPQLQEKGEKIALLIPIGFLCENAEILFDLDVGARGEAEKVGIKYLRAATVLDHPQMASLFTELIKEGLARASFQGFSSMRR